MPQLDLFPGRLFQCIIILHAICWVWATNTPTATPTPTSTNPPPSTPGSSPVSDDDDSNSAKIGVIVLGIVAGILLIFVVLLIGLVLLKRYDWGDGAPRGYGTPRTPAIQSIPMQSVPITTQGVVSTTPTPMYVTSPTPPPVLIPSRSTTPIARPSSPVQEYYVFS
eukprot:NODE_1916_length_698_cov_72.259194_g1866_i0.p1 GENE.NODE_1916_length_698_cov_72.259194_g1866_i0~~NODE_1916_length_698_cov_72.259194_g1866_i0.p1  ORF type:complete len:192 (+),score=31.72 NODE_1916_length_698_cov_72.259194_g1866_i0:80-577(+)